LDYQRGHQMRNAPHIHQDTDSKTEGDDQSTQSADQGADVKAPFAPHENDDSALGDTDQHSTA
jgi:hypothetical protein